MAASVADVMVATLKASGVRRVYGIPGDSLNGFTDAMRRAGGMAWQHVRHEEAAAFAAAAEAALTGELAVCAASCGPGNLHLINGLFDANRSRVPVLAIAAQIPEDEIGSEYFQETHPQNLSGVQRLRGRQRNRSRCRASWQWRCGRTGPRRGRRRGHPGRGVLRRRAVRREGGIGAAGGVGDPAGRRFAGGGGRRAELRAAGTILAGEGGAGAHQQLSTWREPCRRRWCTRSAAHELIEYDNRFDVGMTGLIGCTSGYRAMEHCDALLMLGTDFPYRAYYPGGVPVIQVDARGEQIGAGARRRAAGRHGMAKLMADHRGQWAGTLIPLFQPAEETGDGAQGMVDDGLFQRIPVPDVALTQHVLPGIAGTVSTRSGPFMATEDSINVTVYGKGGHGAMPQHTIDPVVLAAMIIVRLQTIVSRETPPGEIAVVTVGSVHGGTRSNLIPDHALLQLNLRSYSQQTRERMLASIQRIVRAEGQASGSPRDPDFETVGSFPLTVNDPATTDRVAAAFTTHFGDHALEIDRQTVSEDFSNIPNAAGVPYTYWGLGFTDEKTYRAAEKAGRLQDLPTNHSPKFLPPLQPTLRTGTEALVTAALAWLEPR